MVGRKLVMLQNGQVPHKREVLFGAQYLEELKQATIKNVKKHGYRGLVATIRFYVQSSNILKNKFEEIKIKAKNLREKSSGSPAQKQEINNFLKMISEYKHKIREIKHRIKEEEGENQ